MNNKIIKNYVHYKILEIKNSELSKRRKSLGNGVVIQGILTEGQQQIYTTKLSAAVNGGKSPWKPLSNLINPTSVLMHLKF